MNFVDAKNIYFIYFIWNFSIICIFVVLLAFLPTDGADSRHIFIKLKIRQFICILIVLLMNFVDAKNIYFIWSFFFIFYLYFCIWCVVSLFANRWRWQPTHFY